MAWFEIQLEAHPDLRDSLANRLFELGAEGVNESDVGTTNVIRGFFDEKKRGEVTTELPLYLKSLSELFPSLPTVKMSLVGVTQENWADNYKQFYKPQPLSTGFFLRPAWESPSVVPPGMQAIVMEPGQAFGTGLHPSTKLCVRIIERAIGLMTLYRPIKGMRFLDVGTGTGILAIVACKLGLQTVEAIDIDPIAVETAEENFRLNQCSGIVLSDKSIDKLKGPFDIVVSNILLETHKELAKDYARLLPEGGQLILSGLLAPQLPETDKLFRELGFVFESSVVLQEWAALAYTKGAKERVASKSGRR